MRWSVIVPRSVACAAVLLLAIASPAQGQLIKDTLGIDLLRKNFAVPEAPAMTLLDVDSSKILHPSNARELAVDLSNSANGTPSLPSALAVEFSPLLLFHARHTSIKEYQDWQALYRTRLSLATKRDSSTGRTQLAFGLRTSVFDHTDPRTNPSVQAFLVRQVDSVGQLLARIETERKDALVAHCLNRLPHDSATVREDIDTALVVSQGACLRARGTPRTVAAAQQLADSIILAFKARYDSVNAASTSAVLAQLTAISPDTLWNHAVLDVAIAMRGSSADSAGHGLRADAYSAWVTAGTGFSKTLWWLFGANLAAERDTSRKHVFRGSGHLVTRLYVGSNFYKAYGEIQSGAAVGNRASWLFNLGGELALGAGFWTNVTAGYAESGPGTGKIISRIAIRAGLPGT